MYRFLIACLMLAMAVPALAEIQVDSVSRRALSAVFFPDNPTVSVSDSRLFEEMGESSWDMELSGYGFATRARQSTVAENNGMYLTFAGNLDISWSPSVPEPGARFGVEQQMSLYFSAPPGSSYSLVVEGRSGDVTDFAIGDAGSSSFIYQSYSPAGDVQASGILGGSGSYALIVLQARSDGEDSLSGSGAANFAFSIVDEGAVSNENLAWGGIKALFR